ncbi:MAG: PIG-L family deacetylase [Kiritimatiellae bacterium]|nr:PIG-L family deacetylase [Kiritimatiellia bacterium]
MKKIIAVGLWVVCFAGVLHSENFTETKAKENIVICSAHPDDLEGCLGFAIKAKNRFKLHVIDFTGGERGVKGKTHEEARAIRQAEEESVAKELGADVHWVGQIDGGAFATPEAVTKVYEILKKLKPRAVFLHAPVDLHVDHVMCYAACWAAIMKTKAYPEVYFYEEGGIGETHNFHPHHYVDITDVWDEKVRLMRKWKSQNKNDFLVRFKEPESLFRGAQMVRPVKYGEAYESLIGYPAKKKLNVFQEIE